uniref:BTD domain-containing protein n=1 Tax=Panagrellus redivivus TaxID=6233 RepID=A0A7E4V6V8_PANRE
MAAEMTVTREKLAEYLAAPDKFDCGIAIFHADVITMSPGTVNGYFCPPPQVRLFGDGWKKLFDDAENASKLTSDQLSEQPTSSSANHPLDLSSEKKQAAENMLYVTGCAENDLLSLKVNMYRPAKRNPESFLSKQMKVVAEPSSRIRSGSTVAIFNKSETAGTRYLHVSSDGPHLIPSHDNWSPLVIYHVTKPNPRQRQDPVKLKSGDIYHGSFVKLVDRITGVVLPDVRIMKVLEHGVIPLDELNSRNHPVCQLQNYALQMIQDSKSYMSIHDDVIGTYTSALLTVQKMDQITDAEEWTIMSTDEAKFRFYEAMGPVSGPVTPVPTIIDIKMKKTVKSDRTPITLVEFIGSNFRNEHQIWCGLHELRQSPERITCFHPTHQEVSNPPGSEMFREVSGEVGFPITITRSDGVIYGTPYYFVYNINNGSSRLEKIDPLTEFTNS